MYRKLITLTLFLALFAGAAQANAQRIYVYRSWHAPVVVYHRAPAVVYRSTPEVVSYRPNERFAAGNDLQGVVTSSVPYHVDVRIKDAVYSVSLHDGTVIKPVGITLTPAMVVHASGYWSGNTFIANRIVVLR
jgi:hypothetical protein